MKGIFLLKLETFLIKSVAHFTHTHPILCNSLGNFTNRAPARLHIKNWFGPCLQLREVLLLFVIWMKNNTLLTSGTLVGEKNSCFICFIYLFEIKHFVGALEKLLTSLTHQDCHAKQRGNHISNHAELFSSTVLHASTLISVIRCWTSQLIPTQEYNNGEKVNQELVKEE